jgi:hypothetical protein
MKNLLSPYPWIPAHVAISSMAICIGARQSFKRWPFLVTAGGTDRASAAPHASAPAALSATPVGNTGGTFQDRTK